MSDQQTVSGAVEQVSAPRMKRAKCLYCGTMKPVTPSGKIRAHYVIGGPTTTSAGQRVLCGGTGRIA